MSSYSHKIFNKLIHVVAHLFIVLYYKRLTLRSHKLTWSFLQSVPVNFVGKAIKTRFSLEHVVNGPLN